MTTEQINRLVSSGEFPEATSVCELLETHISWVLLCDHFVYKIKKPVQYSFLDFSTLALRLHYCNREIELNRRLTQNVYIEVTPIHEWNEKFVVGGTNGTLTDYAVKMHKLDAAKRMDKLLVQQKVTEPDIKKLAEKIASFHKSTTIIYEKDMRDIQDKFNDLAAQHDFLSEELNEGSGFLIQRAIQFSEQFFRGNQPLIAERLKNGFCRDGHGDLHSRNIFLLPEPVPFDCVEFNDDFRQTDVLNEVAFLCMDLDAFGRHDLSEAFLKYYNGYFAAMKDQSERDLFVYYKSYRANIRAKVNSLRANSAATESEKRKSLTDCKKYLSLMERYLTSLGME